MSKNCDPAALAERHTNNATRDDETRAKDVADIDDDIADIIGQ